MGDHSTSIGMYIFADTEAALARMRATAGAAGCRVISWDRIEAVAVPPDCAAGAALLIELEDEEAGDAAIPLLDWLGQEAASGRRHGVVSGPAGLIDLIAAHAGHKGTEHLCAADEAERIAAVARACRRDQPRVHDMAAEGRARVQQHPRDYAPEPLGLADAAWIRRMIRARRLRTHFFSADLFADPAWDMLLDLMAARLEGKKVAVSSLCIAAAVPPTTALRWLGVLTEQGHVVRASDPDDGRRVHVELSQDTARALGAWLRQARALEVETA